VDDVDLPEQHGKTHLEEKNTRCSARRLRDKSPLATAVLSEHRQLDAHGVLRLDGVSDEDHDGSNAAVEAAGFEQEAKLILTAEARSGNVSTVAGAATNVVDVNQRDEVAAIAHIVLRHEVTTAQNTLERSFACGLRNRVSIVEHHVSAVSQAAATTVRERIVSVDKALTDD